MKKFKDIISMPSEALQAMVDGLLEMDARPDFQIDMANFSTIQDTICFGCAATCTTIKLCGKNLNHAQIVESWANTKPLGFDDVQLFELIMDESRRGSLLPLFRYFDERLERTEVSKDLRYANFHLLTDNWRSQLPLVSEHIEKLRAAGY